MFPNIIARQPENPTITKVMGMVSDPHARQLAGKHGLDINSVVWEDTARTKNSCWGPNISDMTLQVNGNRLPIIRYPNFADLTWDVPMEKIPLVVGNEVGCEALYTVTLKEYLQEFRSFLHDQSTKNWKGSKNSLYASDRDSHVIMSSQACFLPVPKGEDSKFNVAIFNYQSTAENPAVLAIVATSKGTSAQIINRANGYSGQLLYFNKNGEKCSFIGQRLSDHRAEKGITGNHAMTQEEKQDNMVMVIQVPLKVKQIPRMQFDYYSGPVPAPVMCSMSVQSCAPSFEKVNVEAAIVKIGESEGKFPEIEGMEIERDPSFPVRVTLQFYQCTDNGAVNEEVMSTIANQISASMKNADFVGSLVVAPNVGRPTEHKVTTTIVPPSWWVSFWLTYGNMIQKKEEDAKKVLFSNGRFANSSLDDNLREQILDILLSAPIPHNPPAPVVWNPIA